MNFGPTQEKKNSTWAIYGQRNTSCYSKNFIENDTWVKRPRLIKSDMAKSKSGRQKVEHFQISD